MQRDLKAVLGSAQPRNEKGFGFFRITILASFHHADRVCVRACIFPFCLEAPIVNNRGVGGINPWRSWSVCGHQCGKRDRLTAAWINAAECPIAGSHRPVHGPPGKLRESTRGRVK